jgi:acetoin utilization deacetylase AcuC-like enzyme
MGFCLFNNVAIAAESAIAKHGLERVSVLDWDVHHANGTAEIFRRRSDVLFASIHQTGMYPGTGLLTDTGSGTRSTCRFTRGPRGSRGSHCSSGSSCPRRWPSDRY